MGFETSQASKSLSSPQDHAPSHHRRGPDAYHTCYNLAGLSSTQHYYAYDRIKIQDSQVQRPLTAAFNWTASNDTFHLQNSPTTGIIEDDESESGSEGESVTGDCVSLIHPVYVIPWSAAERARSYFESLPSLDI